MSEDEPLEMVVERAAAQSAQSLLLVRICVTVTALILLVVGLIVCSSAAKFGAMFAELGADAELPMITTIAARHNGSLALALLALAGVTTFFIWGKGKAAAWMGGLGLLLMGIFVPITIFALYLPLVKIISEMGNV
ncbi:hypothetical protein [Luteolibacter soli]|uniref:DUF1634 domain-containing protein n=1 Tax=Luteolibacter soli TaxID=3135280 RepID=A0ABU9ARH5_9BACT